MIDLTPAVRELQAGRLPAAEAACVRALAVEPDNADALGLLAYVRLQRGDHAHALEAAARAIALRPQDSRARFNRAMIFEAMGDDTRANADYADACRLDPGNVGACINRGNLLLRHDRLDDAAACFAAAVAADPGSATAQECLGIVRQRQKRGAEAIVALQRAHALAPRDPRIEANLAWALLENDRADEAAQHFTQAAAADSRRADLWAGLAAARLRAGQWAEALVATDRALSLSPGHIRALALRGIALDALGRIDERRAIIDLDRMMLERRHAAPPPGYADLAAFNDALRRHVLAHPTLLRDRPDKTTRLGRQTDDLLAGDAGPVGDLAALFADAVEAYRQEALPVAGPYSAANWPVRWSLRAWATVLDASGHQDPHHHPSGWLSGVYYVHVPPGVSRSPDDSAGWIEFGRPDPFFGVTAAPDVRLFQPEEGLMLLFPSHFWHRTIPFIDAEPRISIAFDLVPVGE